MSSVPEGTRLTRDALLHSYYDACRPRGTWLVGAEFERHLLKADGRPLTYFADHGVRWLLEQLIARGWKPYREGQYPIAARKDKAWVTLEPGAQFELSGAPGRTITEVHQEARDFALLIDDILQGTGTRQVALGFTPFARMRDVPFVPKGRYAVMQAHLGKTGALAHHMMKGTAATQASYDFSSEADCATKVGLSTLLGPLTTAMFANSPIAEGRKTGFRSFRGHIWTQTDPSRTGFPSAAANFTFVRWVDYLLDVPMMFQHIGGEWTSANGRSFRNWMEEGDDGVFPTWDDWELHLTSVFPEVRIKRTIEVRGADCVALPMATAFAALWFGLFYCSTATDQATAVARRFAAFGSREDRFDVACRSGLSGTVGGYPLAHWAEQVVDIAAAGLERCTPGEARWLKPLIESVEHGTCPGDRLLQRLNGDYSAETIIARSSVFREM